MKSDRDEKRIDLQVVVGMMMILIAFLAMQPRHAQAYDDNRLLERIAIALEKIAAKECK